MSSLLERRPADHAALHVPAVPATASPAIEADNLWFA